MTDKCINVTHNEVDCEVAGLAYINFCNVCHKVYADPEWEKLQVSNPEDTQEPHLIQYFKD